MAWAATTHGLAPDPIGNPEMTAKLLSGELGPQAPRHGVQP